MIEWPAEEKLTAVAKSNLDIFKKTAAAKELEADTQSWRFHSWARMPDPPMRMILVNDNGDEVIFTYEDARWMLRKKLRP